MKEQLLINELAALESLSKTIQAQLADMPPGRIRVSTSNNTKQFYHLTEPGDAKGKYIRRQDHQLAEQLAQKTYLQRLEVAVQNNQNAIETFLENYSETNLADVASEMNPAFQQLITPLIETDDQYVARWLSAHFEGKPTDDLKTEFYSDKGERMRSKSEVLIANTFIRKGIPYRYECPLRLNNGLVIYPDFTALMIAERRLCYVEHFGLMGNEEYREKECFWKLRQYSKSGIILGKNLFATFESENTPLDMIQVDALAEMLSRR